MDGHEPITKPRRSICGCGVTNCEHFTVGKVTSSYSVTYPLRFSLLANHLLPAMRYHMAFGSRCLLGPLGSSCSLILLGSRCHLVPQESWCRLICSLEPRYSLFPLDCRYRALPLGSWCSLLLLARRCSPGSQGIPFPLKRKCSLPAVGCFQYGRL